MQVPDLLVYVRASAYDGCLLLQTVRSGHLCRSVLTVANACRDPAHIGPRSLRRA
jgi:hypothetical protein